MDNLVLNATKYTPEIFFDYEKNLLKISGKSYPEDTSQFYTPIIDALEKYIDEIQDQNVNLVFDIIYFNSSTSKVFMDIFDLLDGAVKEGKNIVVNWEYNKENDSLLEYGTEFKEDLKYLPFNLQPKDD
ncbi:MAG: DUF1987 domain-containing protein [Leptospirales bacterium]